MATPLKYIGGLFLGIYGTMMAINGIGKAIAVTEGLSASLMGRKAGYQAASLTSKIAENTATTFGNAQAAISLATEGEKLSFKEKVALKLFGKKISNNFMEQKSAGGEGKSQLIALLLAFFLGGLGIHRFYLGYTWQGVVQLLTAGGCGIWALIDFIRIITGDLKPKDGEYGSKL